MEDILFDKLEYAAVQEPDAVAVIDASSDYAPITVHQLRSRAVWLAHALEARGVARGGYCATNMENCAAQLYLLLAAAYGGFTVVFLNARLTSAEQQERIDEACQSAHVSSISVITETDVASLLEAPSTEKPEAPSGVRGILRRRETAAATMDPALFEGARAQQIEEWARAGVLAYSDESLACIMFTSGTTGRAKAAGLTWGNLSGSAWVANNLLVGSSSALWQLSLPLYHVGGLEIAIRSMVNGNPVILYRHFDAAETLRDAESYKVTHISVVDKMLRDLIAEDDHHVLAGYRCILLGGSFPNRKTLADALDAGCCVYSSFGMTETSSLMAARRVTSGFNGSLDVLPGYEAMILAPDENGVGQLAVKGPGVFSGYLNAQAMFTADGFFITGDIARIDHGAIRVKERTGDMFVSGGENIYPEDIRRKILQVPGVTDAYVYGVVDETWGRRPLAFVEFANVDDDDFDVTYLANYVNNSVSVRLARIYQPAHYIVLPEFPRSGIGKTDRAALRKLYERRLQVQKVELWRIKQPFINAISTAHAVLHDRESIIVRVTDWAGRTGIGENVAFSTPWYLPEVIDEGQAFMQASLIPVILSNVFTHPAQVSQAFDGLNGYEKFPLASAALESALWDLSGKVAGLSIRQLIEGRESVTDRGSLRRVPAGYVPGGAVVGIGTPADVLSQVNVLVDQGYKRVKIKVRPGNDVEIVRAVRQAHPLLTIMLDCNQSYRDNEIGLIREMEQFDIACVEEPLSPHYSPDVGPTDLFARLARAQRDLRVPVCLDESWVTGAQLREALEEHPELRCVSMKLSKFGGIAPALEFYDWARNRGIAMWMGGMFDTGVSKRLHAAFATLPGINLPGDINDTARYFATDVTVPPFALEEGALKVNPEGYEEGLGCELDEDAIGRVAVDYQVFDASETLPFGIQ